MVFIIIPIFFFFNAFSGNYSVLEKLIMEKRDGARKKGNVLPQGHT
jgi:uncharacterized membrane protein